MEIRKLSSSMQTKGEKFMTTNSENNPAPEPGSASMLSSIPVVELFQGYDTFTSSARSTAVGGESKDGGAVAETYYEVCKDISSLRRALHISGSASASFGFGSVDAKSSFVEKLNVTNTSVSIVVYTSIVTSSRTQTSVRLLGDPPSDLRAFCKVNGDSYVGQLVEGAEYAAVYVFYSESVERQREITATLNAKGIGASGSISASMQTSLKEVQQEVKTRKALRQYMSGFTETAFPDADKIIQHALDFGLETPDAPTIISYEVVGYEHVPNMPASFSSVKATRTLFAGFGSQNGLADDFVQLSATNNAISAIHAVHQTYGYLGDATLPERRATIRGDIALLDALFHEMAADPTQTYARPSLEGLTYGEPSLNAILRTVGPWGGNTGEPFRQVDEGSLAESSVLATFQVRGGAWVDQITAEYLSDVGTVKHVRGGNTNGPLSPVMKLQQSPPERVTEIWGTYGGYVNSIKIVTSLGNSFSWPAKPQAAPGTYSWKAEGTTVFLGFAGRSGGYVDQLSLITATFHPARWTGPDENVVAARTLMTTPETAATL
jgi:hypothetical protein